MSTQDALVDPRLVFARRLDSREDRIRKAMHQVEVYADAKAAVDKLLAVDAAKDYRALWELQLDEAQLKANEAHAYLQDLLKAI